MQEKNRVVVAMSGGVDSSVAAALLVEQGYNVIGLMLRLWAEEGSAANRCCTLDAVADARAVAGTLDIPFYVRDYKNIFKKIIVDSFIQAYASGLTPNPCLTCNRVIRFDLLLNEALSLGAQYLVTGHYARVLQNERGEYELWRGLDPHKDQSYVLHSLNQKTLPHVFFPLGNYTKEQVRQLAIDYKLPVFNKPDSQDLCFVGDDGYRGFLQRHAPETIIPGDIMNTSGKLLGQHQGLPAYTIGQRKGLGVYHSEPLFVIRLDRANNRLVVGTRNELGRDELTAHSVTTVSGRPIEEPTRVQAKIRYKSRPAPATIFPLPNNCLRAKFYSPLPDITPGQGFVFYNGGKVLGGGVIERMTNSE
ncbi:MAG: tRNA 2-thiouridine(34) synthase MnmA [Anaerolineaceae bacterium 4572_5.2]|nr:MAG: tRNA 2-thiouridine(34) synthase MnmA [Anaerolineaceae bacterium 4572_5.2]